MSKKSEIKIFVSGIVHGSRENDVYPQCYRKRIVDVIEKSWQSAIVICPTIVNSKSLTESVTETAKAFEQQLSLLKKSNIVVAYIPEASMGTAIEIYNASMRGKYVVTITPLISNRMIRMFSHDIYDSVDSFEHACEIGKFKKDFSRFIIEKSRRTTSIAPRINMPFKKRT
ncbi:MAG: hypothetical protein K8S87_02925 [Planctomycetes bacterium]|nr:hypothetical protein [Planctomycetota bacterium]